MPAVAFAEFVGIVLPPSKPYKTFAGFLLKDARPKELISAVRSVACGDALIATQVTCRLIAAFVASRPSVTGAAERL